MATIRARIKKKTGPLWLADIRRTLLRFDEGRCGANTRVVAAGGKIMPTDGKDRRLRWNHWESAIMTERAERQVKAAQRYVRNSARELRAAKDGLEQRKRLLATHRSERNAAGRSTMRLDSLRSWVREHMPSVGEIATDGALMRLRFCAAVSRGGGRYAISPNRLVIPAMWIGVNVDTGAVVEAKSDGSRSGAFHPHAREDTGDPCAGNAIYRPNEQNISMDTIKMVLAGVERWRLYYGDDHFHRPLDVAKKVWDAVEHGNVGIAPVQGTSGRVYEDLNTLLRAEPWDSGVSNRWCCNCEVPYEACGCCGNCGRTDGGCNCDECEICGMATCSCCEWCEDVEARWGFRGLGNEHEVCLGCGYCRLCDTAGAADGLRGTGQTLAFLTETDIARIQALATIEYGRGSHRPGDYSEGCNCGNCRAHTIWLRRNS